MPGKNEAQSPGRRLDVNFSRPLIRAWLSKAMKSRIKYADITAVSFNVPFATVVYTSGETEQLKYGSTIPEIGERWRVLSFETGEKKLESPV